MRAIADPIPQLCKIFFFFSMISMLIKIKGLNSGEDWLFKAVLLETVAKLIGVS